MLIAEHCRRFSYLRRRLLSFPAIVSRCTQGWCIVCIQLAGSHGHAHEVCVFSKTSIIVASQLGINSSPTFQFRNRIQIWSQVLDYTVYLRYTSKHMFFQTAVKKIISGSMYTANFARVLSSLKDFQPWIWTPFLCFVPWRKQKTAAKCTKHDSALACVTVSSEA